ncbi:MAG TPA: TPM domain-containing protein [Vicinamibacterales bacterium]|nr:TPM domain-containing protein [Vicinamibacterales bacterium]
MSPYLGRQLPRVGAATLHVVCVFVLAVSTAQAQPLPPELTQPVNDFAHVIDSSSARTLDSLIRSLQQTTGDVVVVATIDTFAPYGTIDEYAVKMFENHGRGIGERGRDNGLLILVAIKDRRVKFEVGYELEQFITDGFSGQTSREEIAPAFRRGAYGEGLVAAAQRVINRIAEGRNVTIQGVRPERRRGAPQPGSGGSLIVALIVLVMIINVIAGRLRGRRGYRGRWGGGGGWSSGIGPFGGGFGGGLGRGGGFGGGFGGFGGFGGGRSGGGGGGGSW